jgi:hypothetical protein
MTIVLDDDDGGNRGWHIYFMLVKRVDRSKNTQLVIDRRGQLIQSNIVNTIGLNLCVHYCQPNHKRGDDSGDICSFQPVDINFK